MFSTHSDFDGDTGWFFASLLSTIVSAHSVNSLSFKKCTEVCSAKPTIHVRVMALHFFLLSISQWLSCPLAIWNVLFEVAILLNLKLGQMCLILHLPFLITDSPLVQEKNLGSSYVPIT